MRRPLLIVGLIAAFAACSSREGSEQRAVAARDVVTDFVEAGLAGKKERQIELLASVDRVKARGDDWTPMVIPSDSLEYVVGGAAVDGDRASVHLSLLEGGATESFDVLLIEESGEWRILEGETIERLAKRIAGELSRQFEGLMDEVPAEPEHEGDAADSSSGDAAADGDTRQ